MAKDGNKAFRLYENLSEGQSEYRKTETLPSGVSLLSNITGCPSYVLGRNINRTKPITYELAENRRFEFGMATGYPFPNVSHFLHLQAMLAGFAFHANPNGCYIIHPSDHFRLLGRRGGRSSDYKTMVDTWTRYSKCIATFTNSWKVRSIDENGMKAERWSSWSGNYIEGTPYSGCVDEKVASEIERLSSEGLLPRSKKGIVPFVVFHPRITECILEEGKANRNRIFNKYVLGSDLPDETKAIYCYLWTFGNKINNGRASSTNIPIPKFMRGINYCGDSRPSKFKEFLEPHFDKLRSIHCITSVGWIDNCVSIMLRNINSLTLVKELSEARKTPPSKSVKSTKRNDVDSKREDRNLEVSILGLMTKNATVHDICKELEISRATYYNYRKKLIEKGCLDNKTAAKGEKPSKLAEKKKADSDKVRIYLNRGVKVQDICARLNLSKSKVYSIRKDLLAAGLVGTDSNLNLKDQQRMNFEELVSEYNIRKAAGTLNCEAGKLEFLDRFLKEKTLDDSVKENLLRQYL